MNLSRKAAALRTGVAAFLCVAGFLASAPSAHAYVYSSNNQWASWSSGPWTIYNDVWNPSGGGQWLNVSSINQWNTSSNFWGGGVKAYANESFSPNTSIYGYGIWAYFQVSTPGGAGYDDSFDCWTNDGSEIMIWETWNNVAPAGSVKYWNVGNIGNGGTWNVWQGWVGHNCVSFQRQGQWWSGTEYVTNVIKWAHDHGLISGTTITQVQFGNEVTSTSGWQTFSTNWYTAGWH